MVTQTSNFVFFQNYVTTTVFVIFAFMPHYSGFEEGKSKIQTFSLAFKNIQSAID